VTLVLEIAALVAVASILLIWILTG